MVVVGHRLLRTVVHDRRLLLAGTAVLALGPSTIGLGHVLMTDMAFALVTMVWMLGAVAVPCAPGPSATWSAPPRSRGSGSACATSGWS